jgi:DNA-binding response OmpR family regulator
MRAPKDADERRGELETSVELNGLTLDPEAHEVPWRERWMRRAPTEFRIPYLLG